MSAIKLSTPSSGSISLSPADTASNYTVSIPAVTGTMLTTASSVNRSQLPAGSVLQVVSTTKTDTFSMTGSTFTSVTGLTASITPTSATSKILVIVSMTCGLSSDSVIFTKLMRGGTSIDIGDAAGSRIQSTTAAYTGGSASVQFQLLPQNMSFLDSPATTSSTTYGVQIKGEDGSVNVFVNRASNDADASGRARTASTITVMEIAA
jgi:hypothetical protein